MSKTLALALAATLVPAALLAQGGPNTAPNAVLPGTYTIDPNHTQIGFSVLHMGFSLYSGRFSDASGTLDLKPKAAASSVRISVPVASVSTTSTKLDGELKDVDWLDAKAFPTMTFSSTRVMPGAKGKAKILGDLTLHGVTKPVTLDVRFVGSGANPLNKKYTAGFEITGDIKRSDFGVTKYVPMIGDTVHLTINASLEKS